MNTGHITDSVKGQFFNFNMKPHVEVEMRLGKINTDGSFTTNVGKDMFDRIYKFLSKYDGWEKKIDHKSDVYFVDDIRVVYPCDSDDDSFTAHKKKKLMKSDFKIDNKPLDMRFSISTEIPVPSFVEPDEPVDSMKTRHRTSFIRKNLTIDMTKVSHDDIDDENEYQYQIELEIIDPSIVQNIDSLHNHIHKVFDILKSCH